MIGETISVDLVATSGRAMPMTPVDARYQCIDCKDEQHSGSHIDWRNGSEWGDPKVARYEVTICEGGNCLCSFHIGENAHERDITTREVIFGESPARYVQRAIDVVNLIPLNHSTLPLAARAREILCELRDTLNTEEFIRHNPAILDRSADLIGLERAG